ncbi:MAG TPA: glycosyltransferase family 2 protein [Jiangellaceae bacterium]
MTRHDIPPRRGMPTDATTPARHPQYGSSPTPGPPGVGSDSAAGTSVPPARPGEYSHAPGYPPGYPSGPQPVPGQPAPGGPPPGRAAPGQPAGGYEAPSQYSDPGHGADPDLDAFAQIDDSLEPVDPAALGAHHVTAVMVAHNGERWLERSLTALSQLDWQPDRIVAVDTGSRDGTSDMLASALGAHAVTRKRKTTGFGDAVAAGIEHADDMTTVSSWKNLTEWVWILHDDCAPEPDALRRLLEAAVRRPDAAVIGPKVRSWGEDRQLLEVGLTVTRGGRRHTGLEKREYDQGQHDAMREVLAVGSAGMLVRRDVWDELKGFDKHIAVFRDDIDFGWRANLAGHKVIVSPEAIVTHAEAAARGRRRLGASRARVHLVDRRNALYVMLVNAPARRWLLVLVRLLVSAAGRAFAFLIGKQPALAVEEIGALLAVVLRPDRIIGARVRRGRLRKVPDEELRELFPPAGQQIRHAAESLFGVITGTSTGHDLPSSRRHVAAETGPSEEEEPLEGDSALLEWFARPPVLLIGSLVLMAVVAARSLLGSGRLHGGALFPAPDSAADLWATYTGAWHGIGLGSDAAVQPYVPIIAGLSSVIPSPSVVVDILLLGSVPLSALTAYLVARRLVHSQLLRVWAAAAYGSLPATTGAIAAGRLGTAVAAIVTPLVVLAVMRTLGVAGASERKSKLGPFRAAWSAGLLLAIVTAFVPIAWPAAAILAVIAALTMFRSAQAIARLLAILVVAPVVLVPWTFDLLDSPGRLLTEAGAPGPGLSDPELEPWALLLGQPGGPGGAPIWLFAGVLVAAFFALMRAETLRPVAAAWAVVMTGLAIGLFVSRQAVSGPTLEIPVAGWPGYPAVLVGGGLITATMLGAAGIRHRLRTSSFGFRQPLAVALVMIAGVTPVVAAGWWVWQGSADPVDRGDPALVPAYAADESTRENRVRTLVLDRHEDGRVTYALVRDAGPTLGIAELGSGRVEDSGAETGTPADSDTQAVEGESHEVGTALEALVSDLVSGRGGADAGGLADFAAQYVYLAPPADPGLAEILDTVSGLRRASAPDGGAMWRFDIDVSRVRVVGGPDGDTPVPSGPVDASGTIPPGPAGRTVVISELADPGWTATLDGERLTPAVHEEWAQAFTLPESGGNLVVTYDVSERHEWLWIQLGALVLAFVLALPGMRRSGAVEDVAEVGTDEIPAQQPAEPAAPPPAPAPARTPVYEHSGPPEYAYSQPAGGSYPAAPYAPAAPPDQFPVPGPAAAGGPEQSTHHPEPPDDEMDGRAHRRDAARHSSGKASRGGGKGGKRAKGRRRPKGDKR